MDNLDRKLISALRQDARRSLSELASEIDVSRATVRQRLARLTNGGEILGFTVRLRGEAELRPVRAIMCIEISGRSSEVVIKRLRGLPEVQAIHTTNGRWDILAEIGVEDLPRFDEVLHQIRLIDGIAASETNLLLTTHKST